MLLAIECMIACIIFALIVLPTQYKNTIKYIMSYPPEIRKRVESLPEYKNTIKSTEKGHILKKLIAVFVCVTLLAAVAYFSGAKEYLFHVKGAIKGTVLGIVISLLSASIVYIVSII